MILFCRGLVRGLQKEDEGRMNPSLSYPPCSSAGTDKKNLTRPALNANIVVLIEHKVLINTPR